MQFGALARTLSVLLSLARRLTTAVVPFFPSLRVKANSRSSTRTPTPKYGTLIHNLFSQTIIYFNNSAHLVRWITENNRPPNIINDRKLCKLLTAGQPTTNLPSHQTISRNIYTSFKKCQARVTKLLQVSIFIVTTPPSRATQLTIFY